MSAALRVTLADVEREKIRRGGLREFVKRAWREIEPARLVWGWYHDAICDALEAVTRREIHDLAINQPPGTSKSLVASVLWPAWVWTLDPTHRWITSSFSDEVTKRDARKCRTLVTSEWYRARWPSVQIPNDASASKAVGSYYTTAGGMRYSMTVRGSVTGQHGDTMLVDDPIDPEGAARASGIELDDVLRWWNETMSTRFRDHANSARVLVMQRLHERDLTAEFIRTGAEILCLPMEFEPKHPQRFKGDPRTVEGELLAPDRFPADVVARLKRKLGPTQSAGQMQQRPAPQGGGLFKETWFKFWTQLPADATYTLSVDCTFKNTDDADFVVIQVWCQSGPNFYLVDQHRARMSFSETVAAILSMCARWPRAFEKLIEDKANGSAVIDVLKNKVFGLKAIEPAGGKEARANAVEPVIAGGNVYLPNPGDGSKPEFAPQLGAEYPDGRKGAPWVTTEFIPEVTTFPNAANDDVVDTMTQYLNNAGSSSWLNDFLAANG